MKVSRSSDRTMKHPRFVEIIIPDFKVDLVISKGGRTIKQVEGKSGAKMTRKTVEIRQYLVNKIDNISIFKP